MYEWLKFTLTVYRLNDKKLLLTDKNCEEHWPTRRNLYKKLGELRNITQRHDDTKNKVNNTTKENYKRWLLIATKRDAANIPKNKEKQKILEVSL